MPVEPSGTSTVSRLKRFFQRAGSPTATLAAGYEEALVRAWSVPAVRSVVRPLIRLPQPRAWLFLVGCFNSGTTLLQRLIGDLPGVSCLPREGVRFTDILDNLERDGHHMMWAENYRDFAKPEGDPHILQERIARDWGFFFDRSQPVLCDKSVANTARIEWLASAFPNAHFLGIHRNGYCVAESLRRRARPPSWLADQTGSDRYPLELIARQWVNANDEMLNAFKRTPNCETVSFERLVASPGEVLQSICSRLGLDAQGIQVEKGGVRIDNAFHSIRDPNPASLERLGAQDIASLGPLLEPMMRQLGYAPEAAGEPA